MILQHSSNPLVKKVCWELGKEARQLEVCSGVTATLKQPRLVKAIEI